MDFILKEMEERNADGVDFVPIWFDTLLPPVYASYTKQEWINSNKLCLKTNRMYWRIENGKKVYCDGQYVPSKEEIPVYDFKEIDFSMKEGN